MRNTVMISLMVLSLAIPAHSHAQALAKAAGRAAAVRMERTLAARAAQRAARPRDVLVSRRRYPDAAAHIDAAQRNGQPTVLQIDRKNAAARRTASIGTVNRNPKPRPGTDRDEYPPAFTREGGSGSNVRFIDAHDNRGAGASFRAQTKDLPDGSKIRVLATD